MQGDDLIAQIIKMNERTMKKIWRLRVFMLFVCLVGIAFAAIGLLINVTVMSGAAVIVVFGYLISYYPTQISEARQAGLQESGLREYIVEYQQSLCSILKMDESGDRRITRKERGDILKHLNIIEKCMI